MHYAHTSILPRPAAVANASPGFFVKALTSRLFQGAPFRGVRADEFQELVLGDFGVFGELLGGQASGHGLSEGVALLLQQDEGAAMLFFEGAGPGLA